MGQTVKPWHSDFGRRWRVGMEAEREFDRFWRCHCGGEFVRNDVANPYNPDRRCAKCGQLVDVKTSRSAPSAGFLCISQVPFDNYPNDLIIALRTEGGVWRGVRRADALYDGPFPPAHENKGTWYYKIDMSNFVYLVRILDLRMEGD